MSPQCRQESVSRRVPEIESRHPLYWLFLYRLCSMWRTWPWVCDECDEMSQHTKQLRQRKKIRHTHKNLTNRSAHSGSTHSSVCVFQILMVLSSLTLPIFVPSGLHVTELTLCLWWDDSEHETTCVLTHLRSQNQKKNLTTVSVRSTSSDTCHWSRTTPWQCCQGFHWLMMCRLVSMSQRRPCVCDEMSQHTKQIRQGKINKRQNWKKTYKFECPVHVDTHSRVIKFQVLTDPLILQMTSLKLSGLMQTPRTMPKCPFISDPSFDSVHI
jgi:hypothetical protein